MSGTVSTQTNDNELEFTFKGLTPNRVRVRVNPTHYGRGVDVVLGLAEALKARIPFKHTVVYGPDVHILNGTRVSGIICVQMDISFEMPSSDARSQLQARGFRDEFEPLM